MLPASSGGNIVPVLDIGADSANVEDDSSFEDDVDTSLTGNETDADCGER